MDPLHLRLGTGERIRTRAAVIATGATPRRLPNQPNLAGVFTLRTLDDAVAFRSGDNLVHVKHRRGVKHAAAIGNRDDRERAERLDPGRAAAARDGTGGEEDRVHPDAAGRFSRDRNPGGRPRRRSPRACPRSPGSVLRVSRTFDRPAVASTRLRRNPNAMLSATDRCSKSA